MRLSRFIPALTLLSAPWLLGNKGCESQNGESTPSTGAETVSCVEERAGKPCTDASEAGGDPKPPVDASTSQVTPGSESPPSGADAGATRCGTRGAASCAADQFCKFELEASCGDTDRGGTCAAKPSVCTDIYKPVCGCDGRTYGSDCSAFGAGVSARHEGLCTPEECTAVGGVTKYSDGASTPKCAAGEAEWRLSGGREAVICCLANAGTTPPAGKMCGGIAGIACAASEFCNFEVEAGGQGCKGIADASGICQPTPKACTREYRPVCGCDGKTYATACTAHAAGASVLHTGACTGSKTR